MNKLWWELFPARLQEELEALQSNGIEYQKDEDAFAKGICRLCLKVPVNGKVLDIEAVFPDLYPYFRFQIFAHDIDLPYHQNPFLKNLCLMGRSTANWCPGSDRLADFIIEQLPKVLLAGDSNDIDEVNSLEEHQAEPFSHYFSYEVGTGIIVDSNWSVDSRYDSGTMMIGLNSLGPLVQGAVFEIWNESKSIIVESDNRLRQAFSKGFLFARWVRLSEPPKTEKASDLFNFLSQCDRHKKVDSFLVDGWKIQVRAAVFPEETAWREANKGWGWIFVCEYNKIRPLQNKHKKPIGNTQRKKRKWR